ncbi:MAG: PIN domain-containing protein [Elusimicrobia bacterium]|nr:PIN domain-containing protein [Elusimicrobiota bacterium]
MRPLSGRIFCDTSFFFACLEQRDVNHQKALGLLKNCADSNAVFWTTWDVVSETVTLLRIKSGYGLSMDFVRRVIPTLHLAATGETMRREALDVFQRFAKDKKLSLCDCMSYVVLTTSLEGIPTATFDSHFGMMGLPVLK